MKFLTFVFVKFLFLSNFVLAETIPTKSKILVQYNECMKYSQPTVCKDLVSELEKLQKIVFDQNRIKCQTSLLGLQSEIIEAYFLRNFSNEKISFMIPYVIKNC